MDTQRTKVHDSVPFFLEIRVIRFLMELRSFEGQYVVLPLLFDVYQSPLSSAVFEMLDTRDL
ncbi:hypothetical protein L248_0005 [Schleiferilactobacillus shenzhenensis LY-73]|uniref:Uncharacterized protein n=1 Tax=Schleiferilactobacillus shenzhenensis LY-73 TaxID=1231336 RepID=U4TN86_9LACO|nr:hypothetical protein L248_0005 [Schleiferilactobacillus shenzhenensis LY-73]